MRRPEPAPVFSPDTDWTPLCVEAAVGGLCALAEAPQGKLVSDPLLRLLLAAVASEAAAAAKRDGRRVKGRPAALAERRCRLHPAHRHPWQRALDAGRPTGAQTVLAPLLRAAKRSGAPAPRLALISRVLRLLEN